MGLRTNARIVCSALLMIGIAGSNAGSRSETGTPDSEAPLLKSTVANFQQIVDYNTARLRGRAGEFDQSASWRAAGRTMPCLRERPDGYDRC